MSNTTAEIKEIYYICLLPADELADQICSLPYTLIESMIEAALNNEDGVFELFADKAVNKLKENMHLPITKKALRKILKVCQILGCVGYFDFGDWEVFRDERDSALKSDERNTTASIKPPKTIKDLIDVGQLHPKPESNGKYKPFKTLRQFIFWCVDQNYGDDISVPFITTYIYFEKVCANSIQEYINEAKRNIQ